MLFLMKTFRDQITCSVVLTIIGACAMAFPTSFNRNEQNGDLEALLQEIRKELHMHETSEDFTKFTNNQLENTDKNHAPSFGTLKEFDSSNAVDSNDIFNKDSDRFSAAKRQGAWDYDYGLGGGRFGKRAGRFSQRVRRPVDYFSYGGLGGRFGRDTEHVSQLDAEFDDVTDYH